MNEQTRRYLDEEWLDEQETKAVEEQRSRKNDQRPAPDARRQAQKEWGRAIAKYQRSRSKADQPK
ncbi:MAG: hypothetical protein H0T53_08545 [Herpetosiphonaceae bacterium]|nr:hypothetical protein [Herpetosiphonaceae bacterium]